MIVIGLKLGVLKRFIEINDLPDDTDILVEIQKFTTKDQDIPESAQSGRVDKIEIVSEKRVILTHNTYAE